MAALQKKLEDPRHFRRLVIGVVVLGILVRAAVLVALWQSWPWQAKAVPDAWNKLAINLADDGTFGFSPGQPTISRGPIFPLLELPLYLAFGENYSGWCAGLLLFDTFTCFLVIITFRRLWGDVPALLAGLFCALNLPIVYYTVKISQVTSILPLVVLCIYLFSAWERDFSSKSLPCLLGLISGLMILNKTVYLPIPLACSALLIRSKWRENKRMPRLVPVGLYLLVTAVVVAPWTLRNYMVTGGKLVPVQNMFWELFVQDVLYYDLSKHEGLDRQEGRTLDYFLQQERQMLVANGVNPEAPQNVNRPKWEYACEQTFRSVSFRWMKENPGKLMWVKLANLWNFWVRAENWQKTRLLILMQVLYLGATLSALVVLVQQGQLHRLKYGLVFILVLWAEHCLVFAWGRFSLDLVPILGLIFGLGVGTWLAPESNELAAKKALNGDGGLTVSSKYV
jgi:4-amino-4-deoxy-L-arabinose transferase-like glycosyltransferase